MNTNPEPPDPVTRRVIAYVDGYNLYHGLKAAGWKFGYWLDIPALARRFLEPGMLLVETKYFTSRVTPIPDDTESRESAERQTKYIEALQTKDGLSYIPGQFHLNRRRCKQCSAEWWIPNEKMTDVNIASEMLSDAFLGHFDDAILLSADSDLRAPVEKIKEHFPHRRVLIVFPPRRGSEALRALDPDVKRRVTEGIVKDCQLPETVIGLDGYPRVRPVGWSDSGTSELRP